MPIAILQSIILGLVQGATEFIPVSSSAHLIIVPWLFGWTDPALTSLPFDVALHLGTLAAVLVFFAKDWVRLIRAFFQSLLERRVNPDPDRRLAWLLVIGTIPGAIAGFLFEGAIDDLFHKPGAPIAAGAMLVMAAIIAGFGLILLLADRLARHTQGLEKLNLVQTILIGLSQALAIFPGVSRSGATIASGLALGIKREDAARFSFLLSAPIIAGAGVKSLWNVISDAGTGALNSSELVLFATGFLAAAVSGFFCMRFLVNFLRKHPIDVFVYYRWGLAILVAAVALVKR
ncbi:MAG: undecaprenyl-diphosphate phosphatase [Anaerolineales bacterium]|nr:undecaprenyl-diphosphate phosphatase [Anaerolineales bacterium]